MDIEKCKNCHWFYFQSDAPFHCNYCLLQGGQSAFKSLDKSDKKHKQFRNFDGTYKRWYCK